MTNPRTIAKRQERANRDAGLVFVHGRWVRPEDAERLQAEIDAAADRAQSTGETE